MTASVLFLVMGSKLNIEMDCNGDIKEGRNVQICDIVFITLIIK